MLLMAKNNMEIKDYRNKLERLKGGKERLENEIISLKNKINESSSAIEDILKAQIIIQETARKTQDEIKFHISELVTLALTSVFDDPYEFGIDFIPKRGKTDAEIYFKRRNLKINPIDATGGGAIDIASFALRISAWKIAGNSRPIFILDEPFKNLDETLQPKAGELLKFISKELGIQFIIITHNSYIMECADKTFEVRIRKGRSKVNEKSSKDWEK